MSVYSQKLPEYVKRIINYNRKSRDEELEEERNKEFNALERQKIQMERVLKNYNIPFDQESEIGSGDKIESRPVFQRILDDIRSGKYQAIAVREVQRLGRGSYEDMGQIYTLLEEKRIFIITESRIWDLRNADDAKFIRMQLFMSREEYFMIKERLQGAREYFAGEGKFMCSRPPYGYTSHPKTKRLEINPEQAEIIKLVFGWYVDDDSNFGQGFGYQAIATKLTNMGIRTYTNQKTWQPLQIARVLKNRAYIGEIIYKMTERIGNKQIKRPVEEHIIVPNAHEPIISIDLFNKVQDRLSSKKKKMPITLEFDPCELAGIVTCNCGRKMVRQYSVQKYKSSVNDTTTTYHKEFLYCRGDCRRSIKYRDVEKFILIGLTEIAELSDHLLLKSIESILKDNTKNKGKAISDNIIEMLEKQKSSLQQKLKFIFEQYEDKVYTREEFQERRKSIIDDLDKLELELTRENNKIDTIEESISLEYLRGNVNTAVQAYNKLSHKSHKNELLHEILDTVMVDIIEKGRGSKPSKLSVNITLRDTFIIKSSMV